MAKLNVAVLGLVGIALAGCGSSAAPSPTAVPAVNYSYRVKAAHVPSCAHAGTAIALPLGKFPAQFPFPVGSVIDRTGPLIQKQTGIYGFVPSHSFVDTVNFFKNQVVKQGFKRLDFEVDSPHDSEGAYRGFGFTGRWQLQALPGCKGAMRFSASSGKVK